MQKQAPPGAYPPGTQLTVGSHAVTIKSYISEGGFAHVYVVKISPSTLEGEIACLKRVVVPDKIHLNLLRAEVDAMKRLKGHPNIVRYIDSHAARLNAQGGLPASAQAQLQAQGHGQGGSQVYEVFLLMEYCSGNGLIDFMNTRLREQLTESEILKITSDVTYGLACMHYLQPPLIHRDLKIENILISGDGTYKLCDFGSVSPILRPPRNPGEYHILEQDIQRHTTAQYRSPEMIDIYRGHPIDEKSDIWALGVFLYKLCYYTTPFEREGSLAILHASFSFPPKPVYSDRLKGVISALLREDPRARPNVYQVLKEICAMRGLEVPIKDIYSGATSTAATMVQPTTSVQLAHPAQDNQNHSLSASQQQPDNVSTAQGIVRSIPKEQQQRQWVPEVTPMFRGRITVQQNNSMPSLDKFDNGDENHESRGSFTTGLASAANFDDDPFSSLDSSAKQQRAKTQPVTPVHSSTPQEFTFDEADIESRFPSVEDLARELERTPFEFAQAHKPIQQQTNLQARTQPQVQKQTQTAPQPQFKPQMQSQLRSQPEGQVSQEMPRQVQSQQAIPQPATRLEQSTTSVSRSSRDSTPGEPLKTKPPPTMRKPGTTGTPSGYSAYPLKSASPPMPAPKKLSQTSQPKPEKPALNTMPSGLSINISSASSGSDSEPTPSESYSKPLPRPPPHQIRPRPLSMYSQSNTDAYFEASYNSVNQSPSPVIDQSQKFSYLPEDSNAIANTGNANHTGSLIDTMPPEDREQLKVILTGLSQRSNTVVLDNSENHIDSNVDFLKALDNENTGSRPHHHRKPSQSQYLYPSGTGDGSGGVGNGGSTGGSGWMNRSSSTSRRSGSTSRHSKKPSMTSLKGKIGDAFKKFDNAAGAYRSTSDSSMMGPPVAAPRTVSAGSNPGGYRSSSRMSYTAESPGDYAFSPKKEDDEFKYPVSSSTSVKHGPPHVHMHRSKSRNNGSSSIQSRVQQFLSRSESPPKKTASGYGKYTEEERQVSSSTHSPSPPNDTSSMPPPPPSKQYAAQKLGREVHREIKRASMESTRDWINSDGSGRRNSKMHLPGRTDSQHSRKLSNISSESSGSNSGSKRPPVRPKKPAHLQSPRRTVDKVQKAIDDDWEASFNQKYPSLG
ncbi:serine/threonine protein kinase ARK1 [Sugiyamaella lignohabitans]|uniref:non-specific serine/threonine protein kinase n=1 Tax=Sugiyamaella lignohabitans TaxID=796027 RepID=A0A167C559_9ASCO|nr:serine/threonine protein kinase ARK1 [Sugiyamaella lignohabitans]ANB11229.1 serine/threonine protein kinase ARK1 [Sugiyamaella lignohabitans]